jgi:hypothetical protein
MLELTSSPIANPETPTLSDILGGAGLYSGPICFSAFGT